MSETYTGACVVLVPSLNGLPDQMEAHGGQHITLTYLGDQNLDESQELELLRLVGKMMNHTQGRIRIRTAGLEQFGPEGDASVLRVDDSDDSPAVLFREMLLDAYSIELERIFQKSETFPIYKPHLTLGYASEGYDVSEVREIPEYLDIDGIAVWNGVSRTLIRNRNDETFAHYGILRRSGRYPWGSGENPYARSQAFYSAYNKLKAEGLKDTEIARLFGEQATPENPDFNTASLRRTRSVARDEKRAGDRAMILRLRGENGSGKQMSTKAIAERMDMPEATVRALLKDSVAERVNITKATAERLRAQINEEQYIDIGKGTSNRMGVSPDRLKTAVAILEDEGYTTFGVPQPQLGGKHDTNVKVIAPPGVRFPEVMANRDRIKVVDSHSSDGGQTFTKPEPPKSVDSKRLSVVYDEQGGSLRDGLIEIRPGKKDLDLGNNRYVQVRIAVDDSHYLKGMAVYTNDLPPGVDIRFNTNKAEGTPVLGPKNNSVLKPLKRDKDGNLDREAPFGSMIKPGGQRGALNIVNEEGDWDDWSTKFSSQMLSKQNEGLAKKQLGLSMQAKELELSTINELTNPVVKAKLLDAFAKNADSQATTLKAMALPRTTNKVILPFPEMKPTEVYAPTYKNGERVVLIRHPHGGIFEIPELVVNNRSPKPRSVLADARDAIGIHPSVAEQLSGADFDGDTVLVIPQPGGATGIKRSAPLDGLKDFDAKRAYPSYPGMKVMSNTQRQMGEISNLITDMTLGGANQTELAAAVRHSMVVIDAEKHELNYKQSEIDNGIRRLKAAYQPEGGAATLISRAKRRIDVPEYRLARVKEGGPINKETGAIQKVLTGKSYTKMIKDKDTGEFRPKLVKDPKSGELVEKIVMNTTQSRMMDEAVDARTLISSRSSTPMESIYADHANGLKSIANAARKEMVNIPAVTRVKSAKEAYAPEVEQLTAALNLALQNAPLERQAQIVGAAIVKAKQDANPDMDADEYKKVKNRALKEARIRTGADKQQVAITPRQWEAIQAGAISPTRLREILNNTDLDKVKEYATPRAVTTVSPALLSRARAMAANGAPQSDIAEALGISVSTLSRALK